jgi:hypothetical protein
LKSLKDDLLKGSVANKKLPSEEVKEATEINDMEDMLDDLI